MRSFSIQRGSVVLCAFDLDTGVASLHPDRRTEAGVLVLDESERVSFVLTNPSADSRYRISVGDVPLSDIVGLDDSYGSDMAGVLIWKGMSYFESARGTTTLLLESQPEAAPDDQWQMLLSLTVYVLPSKLGESCYDSMARELQDISRSLLTDLYGKSRQTKDIRYAKEGSVHISPEEELRAIEEILKDLSDILSTVALNPASRFSSETLVRPFWGTERLSPSVVRNMCQSGIAPLLAERPLVIRQIRRRESFDIAEHRMVRAFLAILEWRAHCCARIAREHAQSIISERHLRHIRRGREPTLYELVDQPKIRRLETAARAASRAASRAKTLATLPFLRNVTPELVCIRGGSFQRGPSYQAVLSLIRRFQLKHAVCYEGGDICEITKLTNRLYEQWCYLKLVDAFRSQGLDLREWNDALRQNLRSRFILDFDRGLTFEGILATGLRLRFRYEPWILGTESASSAGETLCRGTKTDVAWSPDVVIECLSETTEGWNPVYALVLDCKYKLKNLQFDSIMKYSGIRCTKTLRQVVKQLWMISPQQPGTAPMIASEDPAVHFDAAGPSCAPTDTVCFRLFVTPDVDSGTEGELSGVRTFERFARGTMNYLLREFHKP